MKDTILKITMQLIVLTLIIPSVFAAKDKYTDPDSPETERAARTALSNAVIKDILGISRGIEGILSDLGAKVSEHEIRIELPADILFDFDKSDIRPDALEGLKKVIDVLKAYPKSPILVEGHTDSKGAKAYNLRLSGQRALSVKKWIVQNGGAKSSQIKTKGYGASKPLAPNTAPDGKDNPSGRQKNRRVEITIAK